MDTQVLVIDDDPELGSLLKDYLAKFGMRVSAAQHPEEGLRLLKRLKPALVILDVMLPGRDGFQVCSEIRRESTVPVIMLTARGESSDRIVGLEIGADDYLPKPFEPRELVARIQAVLRRLKPAAESKRALRSGDLLLEPATRQASLKGRGLDLTTTEFEILRLLMQSPDSTLKREEILDRIRGMEYEMFNRSIDLAISRLRAKLGDSGRKQKFIKTIWGEGYLFLGKVVQP